MGLIITKEVRKNCFEEPSRRAFIAHSYTFLLDPTKASGSKLVGDVEFEEAKNKASWITPVPGGVGPMTVAMLMKNTVLAAQKAALKLSNTVWNLTCLPLKFVDPVPRYCLISFI